MRRILSVLMALLLVCSLPLSALAVEVNVSYGDVTIGDTQVTHTDADSNVKTEDHGGSVTVTDSTTENTITANAERELDLAELSKLVAETGDEFDPIHKGSESTLMLNDVDVEERLLELRNAGK